MRAGLGDVLGSANGVQVLRLRNGGIMSYREYGRPDGIPVVFSHGNTNSRLFEPCWDKTQAITAAAGVRLIAVDRPGIGLSTFFPSRTYLDYGDSVVQLADALQLKRFAVLGFSSGGPHTLAIAASAPSRVTACGLCSSDAPYWLMEKSQPGTIKRMYGHEASELSPEVLTARGGLMIARMKQMYETMTSPEKKALALADLKEASQQGFEGVGSDSRLECLPWGFNLATLPMPILQWHGSEDKDVPFACAQYLFSQLPPTARHHWIPGENHSLIRRRWQNILSELCSAGGFQASL